MTRIIIYIFSVFTFACSAMADDKVTGQFHLEQKAGDLWAASYEFDVPVNELKMHQSVWGYRKSAWALDDGFQMSVRKSEGLDSLYVSRADGKPFTKLQISASPYNYLPEKDYYAFSPFSDGGMSLYSGYFNADARVEDQWHMLDMAADYVALPENHVYTHAPKKLTSQFVYFGPAPPTGNETAKLIVDPLIPDFIRKRTERFMDVVTSAMAQTFDFTPAAAYQVWLAGGELETLRGSSIKGGVGVGQVLFTYKGDQVVPRLTQNPDFLPVFVAHEVTHLFQRDLWPNMWDGAWLHEGHADAFALDILLNAGELSKDEYASLKAAKFEKCEQTLMKSAVDDAIPANNWDAAYNCGAVVQWVVAGALYGADNEEALLRVWANMAALPEDQRNKQGRPMYLDAVKAMGLPDAKMEALQHFLKVKHDDPGKAITAFQQAMQ